MIIVELFGQLVFFLASPFIRLYLSRTSRVYIVVFYGGEILALKNWISGGDWHLPGGGIRRGETAEAAAKREAREEAGINITGSTLDKIVEGIWQSRRLNFPYTILAVNLKEKPKLKLRRPEVLKSQWIDARGVGQFKFPTEIREGITKAAKLHKS